MKRTYVKEGPFVQWLAENVQSIYKMFSERKEYDIYIVLTTYSARKCAIHPLLPQDQAEVSFPSNMGLDTSSGVCAEWPFETMSADWRLYSHEHGLILFFNGFKFKVKDVSGLVFAPKPRHINVRRIGSTESDFRIPFKLDTISKQCFLDPKVGEPFADIKQGELYMSVGLRTRQ